MHRLFRDAESYHATRADKTCPWTRHPSRLDHELGRKRFGDEGYAMEELVAELGSTFLSADLELTPEVREDHERRVECQRHRHGDEFQR
jgi:antirestriction protein ArdC